MIEGAGSTFWNSDLNPIGISLGIRVSGKAIAIGPHCGLPALISPFNSTTHTTNT